MGRRFRVVHKEGLILALYVGNVGDIDVLSEGRVEMGWAGVVDVASKIHILPRPAPILGNR